MNYQTALKLFEHTLRKADRVRPDIHAAMLKLATREAVEAASQTVSVALALGQRVWMTSDLHLGHANIIGYCDRPYSTVDSMHADLLRLLGKVGPTELLVIVGDVLMGDYDTSIELVRDIPGRKILVLGNHDLSRDGKCRLLRERAIKGQGPLFEAVVPFLFWSGPEGRSVLVSHYPVVVPDSHLAPVLNYHGHLHREVLAPTFVVKYMNVGWDVDYCLRCL